MITDTKEGQTNYCPNCEDQARRIEELERHNRIMLQLLKDGAEPSATQEKADDGMCAQWDVDALAVINANSSHSAAWEWNQHVEWMKKLKPVVWQDLDDGEFITIHPLGESGYRALVAIPELK